MKRHAASGSPPAEPDRGATAGGAAPLDLALDLDKVRARLAGKRGPELWRSLEELAATEEFQELLYREFPRQAPAEWPQGVDRRRFLQLMSASLALGGLAACSSRQPLEQIVPYAKQPEEIVPGRPLYFATAATLDGYAVPLLAESHTGRPTKLEGNPEHPASLGASDLFAQASVLGLYDPDRSQVVKYLGRIRGWADFNASLETPLAAQRGLGGQGLAILTGTVTSPSLADLLARLRQELPRARWHQWDAVGREPARAGARRAFGEPVETYYDLARAEVVLALDADLLTAGPGSLRYARDFMDKRRVRRGETRMNRLYAVESTPTGTGTLADHRLALPASELGRFALALAAELGVAGASAPAGLGGETARFLAAAARDLAAHRGTSLVAAGEQAPAAVHVLAHAINQALGNLGATLVATEPVAAEPADQLTSLAELVAAMTGGEIDLLLVVGGNPVFDAPADLGFTEALDKVALRVRLGLYEDETSDYCHWHLPETHFLESWGDARAYDGTVTLTQPLIEPLYQGRSAHELLSALTRQGERPARELVAGYWRERRGGADFDPFWRKALHDGFVAGSALPLRTVALAPGAVAEAAAEIAAGAAPGADSLDLVFRPDPTIYDGRFANNGWLQECPKPFTKLTWDNAALLGPALAERLGVTSEQVVRLAVGGRSVELPVFVQPGQAERTITVHLGYGRRRVGAVGTGAGADVYPLRTSGALWLASGVVLTPTPRRVALASTQVHHAIHETPAAGETYFALEGREAATRHVLRVGTLAELRADPGFVREMEETPGPEETLNPPYAYPGHAWGLSVDLSSCTGCNACVVACQAENNIPVVGKEQVLMGREMHWLRIDRYYQGDLDAPAIHHQPVMCMQCEMAPCELVCPVGATVHSSEGLNDMVYNRCVGTRYCSNNCPYKVRRFNFLQYQDTETEVLKMLHNPDVTVRSRGVMEKCTYCVQRINRVKIDAEREDRKVADGEIRTACQQACPTRAIVFGDLNDPASEVARLKAEPLDYALLGSLNTRPRTTYLAKLRNPNPELESA